MGAQRDPMRARRAPQCPPQELEGRARRALNFLYIYIPCSMAQLGTNTGLLILRWRLIGLIKLFAALFFTNIKYLIGVDMKQLSGWQCHPLNLTIKIIFLVSTFLQYYYCIIYQYCSTHPSHSTVKTSLDLYISDQARLDQTKPD